MSLQSFLSSVQAWVSFKAACDVNERLKIALEAKEPEWILVAAQEGAEVDLRIDGLTLLQHEILNQRSENALALIRARANVHVLYPDTKSSLLHCAASLGMTRVSLALIDAGIALNSLNHKSQTPLFMAASKGKLETLKALLSFKGIKEHPSMGYSLTADNLYAFIRAAEEKDLEALNIFLSCQEVLNSIHEERARHILNILDVDEHKCVIDRLMQINIFKISASSPQLKMKWRSH